MKKSNRIIEFDPKERILEKAKNYVIIFYDENGEETNREVYP